MPYILKPSLSIQNSYFLQTRETTTFVATPPTTTSTPNDCKSHKQKKEIMMLSLSQFEKDESYDYQCEKCNKAFKRKSGLKRHLLSLSVARLFFFFCHWCLSKPKRRDNLLQHFKSKHPKYLYEGLKSSLAPFKWQKSKNINFC